MTRNRRKHWARRRPQREFARQLWAVRAGLPLDAATIRALADVAKQRRDYFDRRFHWGDTGNSSERCWRFWHETYLWLQHEATRANDAARRAGEVTA